MKQRKVVIVGCGWLGQQLAEPLSAAGFKLWGSRQSPAALQQLPAQIQPLLLQLPMAEAASRELLSIWQGAVVILSFPVSMQQQQGQHYLAAVRSAVALAQQSNAHALIMCSSTGIFEGCQGILDEQSPTGDSIKANILAQAEQLVQSYDAHYILRLAGLMGPGRHPGRFARHALTGESLPVNLVHSDDVAAFISCCCQQQLRYGVYHVCCPEHPTKLEFYTAAAQQLGLAVPAFKSSEQSARTIVSQITLQQPIFQYKFSNPLIGLCYCQ